MTGRSATSLPRSACANKDVVEGDVLHLITRVLALGALNYDAEPVGVGFVNTDGRTLGCAEWPPGLCQGEHPVLGRDVYVPAAGTLAVAGFPLLADVPPAAHYRRAVEDYEALVRRTLNPA